MNKSWNEHYFKTEYIENNANGAGYSGYMNQFESGC